MRAAGLCRLAALATLCGGLILLGMSALPLTRHAAEGHTGEYNVEAIVALFANGGCKPRSAYICAGEQIGIALCGIKPDEDIYGGLVVGWRTGTPQVVTGYASRLDYWERNLARRGCVRVPYWLFWALCALAPLALKVFARKHSDKFRR